MTSRWRRILYVKELCFKNNGRTLTTCTVSLQLSNPNRIKVEPHQRTSETMQTSIMLVPCSGRPSYYIWQSECKLCVSVLCLVSIFCKFYISSTSSSSSSTAVDAGRMPLSYVRISCNLFYYRVAQIKIPHQIKCNFSTTVWDLSGKISGF